MTFTRTYNGPSCFMEPAAFWMSCIQTQFCAGAPVNPGLCWLRLCSASTRHDFAIVLLILRDDLRAGEPVNSRLARRLGHALVKLIVLQELNHTVGLRRDIAHRLEETVNAVRHQLRKTADARCHRWDSARHR